MDCSVDTMTNRLLQRSQGSQRGDSAKSIAKRLEAYHRASIPVITYYETRTQLQKASVTSCFIFSFSKREEVEASFPVRSGEAGLRPKYKLLSSLTVVPMKGVHTVCEHKMGTGQGDHGGVQL